MLSQASYFKLKITIIMALTLLTGSTTTNLHSMATLRSLLSKTPATVVTPAAPTAATVTNIAESLTPQEHLKILQTMIEPLTSRFYVLAQTAKMPWLPDYRIKSGTDRITGAAIMQACIDREKLQHLRLPVQVPLNITLTPLLSELRKTVPATIRLPEELGFCLCEDVPGTHPERLNLAQTKDLATLIIKASRPWNDGTNANLILTPDHKIALIDTELRGFEPLFYTDKKAGALQLLYGRNRLEPDAQAYLKDVITQQRHLELP